MPSGARTIEQGRPVTCGNSHSPTASKYSARSSLVTGLPSPASGHSCLSGLEMLTPRTVPGGPALLLAALPALPAWPLPTTFAGLFAAVAFAAEGFPAAASFPATFFPAALFPPAVRAAVALDGAAL